MLTHAHFNTNIKMYKYAIYISAAYIYVDVNTMRVLTM